jgi:hypothetical protein
VIPLFGSSIGLASRVAKKIKVFMSDGARPKFGAPEHRSGAGRILPNAPGMTAKRPGAPDPEPWQAG